MGIFDFMTPNTKHLIGQAATYGSTVIVALTAIVFGYLALREARNSRIDQLRPVLYATHDGPFFMEEDLDKRDAPKYGTVRIANVGQTPASDVTCVLYLGKLRRYIPAKATGGDLLEDALFPELPSTIETPSFITITIGMLQHNDSNEFEYKFSESAFLELIKKYENRKEIRYAWAYQPRIRLQYKSPIFNKGYESEYDIERDTSMKFSTDDIREFRGNNSLPYRRTDLRSYTESHSGRLVMSEEQADQWITARAEVSAFFEVVRTGSARKAQGIADTSSQDRIESSDVEANRIMDEP